MLFIVLILFKKIHFEGHFLKARPFALEEGFKALRAVCGL